MSNEKPYSIDIKDLLDEVNESEKEAPVNLGSSLIIEDQQQVANTPNTEIAEEKEYDGLGAVVDAAEYEQGQNSMRSDGFKVNEMKPETVEGAKQWLKDADEKIEEIKENLEKKGIDPNKPQTTPESAQEIVNIFIDRAQVGELQFTEEQQKHLEFASKIIVNEVNNLDYKTIKITRKGKSVSKKDKLKIIEKSFDRTLSPFIALGSGYMGKMGNCSVSDIYKLGRHIDSGKSLVSELERWKLLFEKIKYCSIGEFKDFDDFMKNTAYDDYENLQFALICATFPAETNLEFNCPECKKKFKYTVENKNLLDTSGVDDNTAEMISTIIKSDTFIERAKEVHENAPFNKFTRMALNDNDPSVLVELYIPSAYDAIHRIYEQLDSKNRETTYQRDYSQIVKYIHAIFIATDMQDNEYVYTQFDEPDFIFKILEEFSDIQFNKIFTYLSETYLNHRYFYSVRNVVCPNEECHHKFEDTVIDMDSLLFLKVRPQ